MIDNVRLWPSIVSWTFILAELANDSNGRVGTFGGSNVLINSIFVSILSRATLVFSNPIKIKLKINNVNKQKQNKKHSSQVLNNKIKQKKDK